MKFTVIIIAVICLMISSVAVAEITNEDVEKFFYDYIDALKNADYLDANNHWSLLDQEISNNINISYQKIPVKLESGSVLSKYLTQIQSGTAIVEVADISSRRGYAKIEYLVKIGENQFEGVSYANISMSEEPALTTPITVFSDNWETSLGRYFTVSFRDYGLFLENTIENVDQYINRTARKLRIPRQRLAELEMNKFPIFICDSPGMVKQLTGEYKLGGFVPGMNAVVSKYFPPYNEITTLLINFKLGELPIATLPFIKYGTATFLAGRTGRTADVTMSVGSYIYKNDFAKLEDMIVAEDFRSLEENPDFCYPITALFCEYLFEKLGTEKYFELYRGFSGSAADIEAITIESFKNNITAILDQDWIQIEKSFKQYAAKERSSGITPIGSDSGSLIFESGIADVSVKIYENITNYDFIITTSSDNFSAVVFSRGVNIDKRYESFFFSDQYPMIEYQREHYGISFSSTEAGCYNYFTNEIIGKYIVGFTGEKPLNNNGTYRFQISKDLLVDFNAEMLSIKNLR